VSTVESAVDPATRPQHVSQIKQEQDGENQRESRKSGMDSGSLL